MRGITTMALLLPPFALACGGATGGTARPDDPVPARRLTPGTCATTLLVGGTVRIGFRPDDNPQEALGITADGRIAAAGTTVAVRAAACPDAEEVDLRDAVALPGRAVLLTRVDGHVAWASSSALAAAGVEASTAEPPGGAILRRSDGEPTGVLVDNAIDLVGERIPPRDPATRRADIERALGWLAGLGLTCVHDMGTAAADLAIYEALASEGLLPLRVVLYLDGTGPLPDGVGAGPLGSLLEVAGVKMFADGALGSRGALLREDYADQPGHRGLEVTGVEGLVAVGREAASRGLAPAIHAIGDGGIGNALDALERLRVEGALAGRPRIEHLQVLFPDDLPRLATLWAAGRGAS